MANVVDYRTASIQGVRNLCCSTAGIVNLVYFCVIVAEQICTNVVHMYIIILTVITGALIGSYTQTLVIPGSRGCIPFVLDCTLNQDSCHHQPAENSWDRRNLQKQ